MRLHSPAFQYGQQIPRKYTCDGEDVSPPLIIEDVPGDAKALVIIVEDPDAPKRNFTHWVIYNIPPATRELPEGIPKVGETTFGLQGVNDFGKIGWGGPCPPRGHGTHRYFFRLYALDTVLDLRPGATKEQVRAAMQGRVLAEAEYMGVYSR